MKNFIKNILSREIGERITGLKIDGKDADYSVLNERSVRATAGIMFLIGIITFFLVISTKNFLFLYPTLTLFWLQFFISVFWWPKYAPISFLGKFLTRKQKPEYVGAVQKRFAWTIGLVMATIMFVVTLGMGISGVIPFMICGICLTFMWLETAIGYCVGCSIYAFLLLKKIIPEPKNRPACPGGACGWKPKQ